MIFSVDSDVVNCESSANQRRLPSSLFMPDCEIDFVENQDRPDRVCSEIVLNVFLHASSAL